LRLKGQTAEAIVAFEDAIRLKPDHAKARTNLGNVLTDEGRLDDAIREFGEAIRLDKTLPEPHGGIGVALIAKGRLDEAIAAFREAIRLNSNDFPSHNNLGAALYEKGRLDEAIAAFREAIRLMPYNGPCYFSLGKVLVRKQAWGDAIAALKKATQLELKNAVIQNELAWLLATCPDAKFRDPKRAVEAATKAVELAAKGGGFWNTLGVAHYRAGDWKAAVAALEKSMELSMGGGATDWFVLAMAHWRLGDKKDARKWYDQAVQWMDKNQPKNEELVRFRAEAELLLELKK
jgi:tetratricopeptide (TPR) repeat protein